MTMKSKIYDSLCSLHDYLSLKMCGNYGANLPILSALLAHLYFAGWEN